MMNPIISLNVKPTELNNQYRKELLIRRNNGRHIMHNYVKKIKSLFNIKDDAIELLGLYESDNIYFNKDYNKKYKIVNERLYLLGDYGKLYDALMSSLAENEFIYFIDDDWKNCGALKLAEKHEYNLTFGLGKYQINNEAHFISTDQEIRILLDYTRSKSESTIEFIVYKSDD